MRVLLIPSITQMWSWREVICGQGHETSQRAENTQDIPHSGVGVKMFGIPKDL